MSAWKKPSRSACVRKLRTNISAMRLGSCPAASSAAAIADRRAFDPFGGQHAALGARPVDRRHTEIRVPGRRFGELRCRRRFHAQIELQRDGCGQRIDQRLEPAAAAPPRRRVRPCARQRRRPTGRARNPPPRPAAAPSRPPAAADRPPSRPDAPARWRLLRPVRRTPRTACRADGRGSPRPRACAASIAKGGNRSCRSFKASETSSPTMSGRVARIWPSLI